MHKVYFFSDAHLGLGPQEVERQKERMLVRFLNAVAGDAEELFIVGDLFDFWFEYRTVVPKGYIRLFAALAALTDAGCRITYVAGNHDFWVKDYFRDELGIEVSLDPIERTLFGKRFYIHHGDGLLRDDAGYRMLKRILRNRVNIFLFSLLHPDLAERLARWSSRSSRRYTGKRTYEELGMVEFAEQKLRQGFDYVVMGHNHRPQLRNFTTGAYVNLGDWISEHSYAVFDGSTITLERFPNT